MLSRLVVCLAGIAAVSAFAQQGDLSLSGIVINSKTGEPIKRAMVTINGFPTQALQRPGRGPTADQEQVKPTNRSTFTDSVGEFHFTGLTAGRYVINAQKPEFTPDLKASAPFRGMEISSSTSGVRVSLSPLGVISGKIVAQDGLPTPGVNVSCLTSQVIDGQRQVRPDRTVTTDDRGVYRFWNLAPGTYFVKTSGFGAGTAQTVADRNTFIGDESFGPTYFGGGNSLASAAPIEIEPGDDVTADLSVKVQTAFRVAGTIANYVPRHAVNFQLRTGDDDVSSVRAAVNVENGRFQLTVPIVSGAYVLRATQDQTVAETPFVVRDGDVTEVALVLRPRADIPVVTRFTGSQPTLNPPGLQQFTPKGLPRDDCFTRVKPVGVLLTADPLAAAGASPADNGIHGLAPGGYRISVSCSGGYARSVVSGTHDLVVDPVLRVEPGDAPPPIEILALYGGGSISGKIASGCGEPTAPATVILEPRFPNAAGPQMGFAAHAAGSESCQFFFAGLAPGSYTLYAFARNDIEFRNPEFLQTVSGGVGVEIEDNAQKEVTIDKVNP